MIFSNNSNMTAISLDDRMRSIDFAASNFSSSNIEESSYKKPADDDKSETQSYGTLIVPDDMPDIQIKPPTALMVESFGWASFPLLDNGGSSSSHQIYSTWQSMISIIPTNMPNISVKPSAALNLDSFGWDSFPLLRCCSEERQ